MRIRLVMSAGFSIGIIDETRVGDFTILDQLTILLYQLIVNR